MEVLLNSSALFIIFKIATSLLLGCVFIFTILFAIDYWDLSTKRGQVLVIDKFRTPAHYESNSVIFSDLLFWTTISGGEIPIAKKWWLTVRFGDNRECMFDVTEDSYGEINKGDKIIVKYCEGRIFKSSVWVYNIDEF